MNYAAPLSRLARLRGARGSAPLASPADVVILSISARLFVPRNVVTRCNPLVSIAFAPARQRELGQRAFENCDAPKMLPVYTFNIKRFEQLSTYPFITVLQKQMKRRKRLDLSLLTLE